MGKKHLHILLGVAVVLVGGSYLLYKKQTTQAAMAAKGGTTAFTGGYAMADGTGSQASITAQLQALNCMQLAQLYNKLKAEYISSGNGAQYMDAMSVVMAIMIKKGCSIEKN